MPEESSPGFKSRLSSRFSYIQKRVSSALSPSSPNSPSRQHSPLPTGSTGGLDEHASHIDTPLFPYTATDPPLSSLSGRYVANTMPAHPTSSPQEPISHLNAPANHDYSCVHPVLPSLPLPPDTYASTSQEPSYLRSAMSGAHDFIMNYPVFIENNTTTSSFMEKLLQYTIIGAEFDSSDRDPPPRCHPGTRLAIIQRCLDFILQCGGEGKLRWVVGPAGVGKSAVMQMVTEKIPHGVTFASVFFSVNGRRDGTKTIITIVYQLAVKCRPYRQFIQDQISLDPSLLRKSLSVQFNKFIVEPFVLRVGRFCEPSSRSLIVIDGLDECDSISAQQKLLGLITDFCITYPTSPLVWIVASRPEPHITSFFDKAEVKPAYIKEEMEVNSDEACEEVHRYLRDELKKIKFEYPTLRHKRQWPLEHEFTKIASSAGGLFAYAATVVRYIGDPHYRDPATQLRRVLEIIDVATKDHVVGKEHPMAQLDALYRRILSNIPDDIMINTRKLLLIYSKYGWAGVEFRKQCNRLGLTEDTAYSAICHLHAVLQIPELDKADDEPLSYHHKSFVDFLFDFERSGFSDSIEDEAENLKVHIIREIVEGVVADSDGKDMQCLDYGCIRGNCENVALSWPGDERFEMADEELQNNSYNFAMFYICFNFNQGHEFYKDISCFHLLTTRFVALDKAFPFYKLRDCAFGQFRHELIELGKMKRIPLRTLNYSAICGRIDLQFTSHAGVGLELSGSWNSSCNHQKRGLVASHHVQGWSTKFGRYQVSWGNHWDHEDDEYGLDTEEHSDSGENLCHERYSDGEDEEETDIPCFNNFALQESHKCFASLHGTSCDYCLCRFAHHFMSNQDQLASVFIDSTQMCYVELSFVDPRDGVSEWRYRFLHSGLPTGAGA